MTTYFFLIIEANSDVGSKYSEPQSTRITLKYHRVIEKFSLFKKKFLL